MPATDTHRASVHGLLGDPGSERGPTTRQEATRVPAPPVLTDDGAMPEAGHELAPEPQPVAPKPPRGRRVKPTANLGISQLKWIGLALIGVATLVTLTVYGLPVLPVLAIALVAFMALGSAVGRVTDAHPPWLVAARPIKLGPRRLLWQVYVGWEMYRIRAIPIPRAVGLYSERRRENENFIYDTRKETGGTTVVKSGKGGAGKSTLSHVIGVAERVITHEPVLVVDTDSGGGALIKRFELSPDTTLSTDQLVDMAINHGWVPTIADANRFLGYHSPTGVAVTYMEHGSHIGPSDFDWTVRALRKVFHSVVVDTTPGYKEQNTLAVIRNASVIVIPGNIHADDDMDQVVETLDHPEYELRARYDRGEGPIIAISAIRWWQYNVRTVYELAKRFDVDPEHIVLLPYSRWLKNQRPVNYQRDTSEYGWPIGPKYRYAVSWLLRRKTEMTLQHNRNNPPAAIPGAPAPLVIDHPVDDALIGPMAQEGVSS